MYSIFWRIFASFWVVVLAAEYAAVWSTAVVSESELHPALDHTNRQFVLNSGRGANVLRERGLEAYRSWRADKSNLGAIAALYLLDAEGNEIDGRELPPDVASDMGNPAARALLASHTHPIEHVLTYDVTTPDGVFYVLIALFKPPHVLSYTLTPQRIAFGIVASGIVCFLLARYIAAPIVRLRQTTQALAGGFDYMAARLTTLVETQKQLLRDVSHELRSPLARIHVALELARNEAADKAGGELNRIGHEADRLNALIDELLKLARITGTQPDETSQFDLGALVTEIVNDAGFERGGGSSGFIFLEHCDSVLVVGNEPLLYSAIENVVRNACYYAPEHGRVVVRCIADFDNVTITVEDNGPGIPESMLAKVFDPFVRVSAAREKETGGYGIGLSIVKRAISLHGGTISARNNEGYPGLTMTISLPTRTRDRRVRAI